MTSEEMERGRNEKYLNENDDGISEDQNENESDNNVMIVSDKEFALVVEQYN